MKVKVKVKVSIEKAMVILCETTSDEVEIHAMLFPDKLLEVCATEKIIVGTVV